MIQFRTPTTFSHEIVPSVFDFTLALVDNTLDDLFIVGKIRGTWHSDDSWLACSLCGKLWGRLTYELVSGPAPSYVRHGSSYSHCPKCASNPIDILGFGRWMLFYAADRSLLEFLIMNSEKDFEYDPRSPTNSSADYPSDEDWSRLLTKIADAFTPIPPR